MKILYFFSLLFLILISFFFQTPKVTFSPFGSSPFWYGEQTSFSLGYTVDDVNIITPTCSLRIASVIGNEGASAIINPTLDAVLVTWGNQKTRNESLAKVKITLG
ncbi:hypothetical protein [Mongoliitalea daihaiensis]|uniref:hypothetical protein n=1 Tax=Mongoliitalea daihaiensis TaxID=2782006 RepID=UPI001F2665A9|nr:hypothetical protein [Mongoliitalea daihaiensis]UJP66325.1 hypothetical protein IPZ59_06830 [Mongoliitalea daihaiensis]